MSALRGLSVDRYLDDPEQLAKLAATVLEVRQVYVERLRQAREIDTRSIDNDAAVRLWMLAALAARQGALHRAVTISARALVLAPSSIFRFSAKVAARYWPPRRAVC